MKTIVKIEDIEKDEFPNDYLELGYDGEGILTLVIYNDFVGFNATVSTDLETLTQLRDGINNLLSNPAETL